MTIERREYVVKKYGYCVNCLAKSHKLSGCTSIATCRKCDYFHHTLLHHERPHYCRSIGIKTEELRERQRRRNNPEKKPKSSNITPSTSTQQSVAPATPDTKVIMDAIRTLANVLCVSSHEILPNGKAGAMSK